MRVCDWFRGWDVMGFVFYVFCVFGMIENWWFVKIFGLKGLWFFRNDFKNYGILIVVFVFLDFMFCDSILGKFGCLFE